MARASASVVGSGTVGPEPITAGSSPGTSEMPMVTSRAGKAWRASRPPLMRDRCLRTVLISPIDAPERSSARVTACFDSSDRPCAGAIQFADAPPDISTSTRSSGVALVGERKRARGGIEPGLIRHRVTGLHHVDHAQRPSIAVTRDRDPGQPVLRKAAVEIMRLRDLGHRACGLAGCEQDQPARSRRVGQQRRQAA